MRHFALPLGAFLCTLAAWGYNSATGFGALLGGDPSAIVLDQAGNIIVVGSTSSLQVPVTNGSSNAATNFMVSLDHGQTWRGLSNLPSGVATGFAVGPATWPVVFAVSDGRVYKSLDGGAGWTQVAPVPGVNTIAIDPIVPQVVYAGSGVGIYKSGDGGATWTNIGPAITTPGSAPPYIAIDPFHPGTIYTRVNVLLYRTLDGGNTWSTYVLPGEGNIVSPPFPPAFDTLQAGVIYATGGTGIFRSGDGGQSWVRLQTPFSAAGPVTVSAIAPGVIWVRDQDGHLYRSNDQGVTLTLLPGAPDFQTVVDPFNPSVLLTDGHRSSDGGATWQLLPLTRRADFRFDAAVPGRVIAMAYPGGNGFVAKLDAATQKVLFATYLGGLNGTSLTTAATDSAGNIYVAGNTAASDFPVTAGAAQATAPVPGAASFAAKYDTAGNLLYATYLPVTERTYAAAIGVDREGNAIIAGQTFLAGNVSDCFVTTLSPDGGSARVHANFAHMSCDGVAFDRDGNVAAVGTTIDPRFPVTSDALQRNAGGAADAVVMKFNAAGEITYASYVGGAGPDRATAVAFDSEGGLYIAGTTKSKDFPVTEGAFQSRFTADCPYPTDYVGVFGPGVQIPVIDNQNSFVARLDRGGALIYSTYLGGNCKDSAYAITVDAGGNAWVTGSTDSSTFPQVWPVDEWRAGASYQGFVTRIAASGAWVWRSSYLSTIPSRALAADATGNAYLGLGNGIVKVTPQP